MHFPHVWGFCFLPSKGLDEEEITWSLKGLCQWHVLWTALFLQAFFPHDLFLSKDPSGSTQVASPVRCIDICFINFTWNSSWLGLPRLSSKKGRRKQPASISSACHWMPCADVLPETLPVGFCVLWEWSGTGGWRMLAYTPLEMIAEAALLQSQPSGYVKRHQVSISQC